MGSLADVESEKRQLTREIHQLACLGVQLVESGNGGVVLQNTAKSSLIAEVKERQYEDLELVKLRERVPQQKKPLLELKGGGVLRYRGHLCVPDVAGLRDRIMSEAHYSWYSIHPGSTKMYHDIKDVYWWNDMKKNITEYVAQCPSCQLVKIEHQKPGGLTQTIEIPTWEWEAINMDFITGLPRFHRVTYKRCDEIWKERKLSPWFIGPYRIIWRVDQVAYELELLSELESVHPVFHVSMLQKCIGDTTQVVPINDVQITEELKYDEIPVAILDQQIRKLRNKEIVSLKVLWISKKVEEMPWEEEEEMKPKYPHLFQAEDMTRGYKLTG
ncbi:uncharacterized protein [Nicotiana sylvestris]|uniref:uncharacterized protein n=1 Tax=Nicotiana sylvestris TaxID=4096 RepID=UPI00388CB6C9